MIKTIWLSLFSLFLALHAQDTAPAAAPNTTLSIAAAKGIVEMKTAGSEAWQAAGETLNTGDALRVSGPGSTAELMLDDGSVLKLADNASIEITSISGPRSITQKTGGVFYKITPGSAAFSAVTPFATAAVHGTDFAVKIKDNGPSSFAVIKGKIGVKGLQGEEVFVKAGELCRAAANAAASIAEPIPADVLKKLEEWGGTTFEPYQEPPLDKAAEGAPAAEIAAAAPTPVPEAAPAPEPTPAAEAEAAKTPGASPAPPAGGAPATEEPSKKEEKPEPAGKKEGIQWSLGIGAVTVDGKNWSRLSLRPDIPLGPFGICLDLEIFLDDKGDISNKGWRFDNRTQAIESMQRKIYYVRYGHPGDRVYARLGALDNVTLGYGLIMVGYSNALQYPDVRKMGLQLELNELPLLGFGVQAMVNNFQDFQRDGALLGVRPFFKPLSFLGLPLIRNLTVGATYVGDLNQRASLSDRDNDLVPDVLDKAPDDKFWAIVPPDYSRYPAHVRDSMKVYDDSANQVMVDKYRGYIEGKDPFAMGGLDVGLPILSTKFLSLIVYGQIATTLDKTNDIDSVDTKGWGLAMPGVGVTLGPLKVNVEYRHFKNRFQGGYFDQTYELDRMKQVDSTTLVAKETFLTDSVTMDGPFGRATLNIINLLEVGATYQWMTIKYENKPEDSPEANQTFSASASVGETIRNILRRAKVEDVQAYYSKKYIGTWPVEKNELGEVTRHDSFLGKSPFVLTGYKVGFQITSSLVLYWNTQYTYVLNEETRGDAWDLKAEMRRNVEAVVKF